jgi:hypothetical protein
MEDIVFLVEGGDLSYYYLLYYFAKATEEANNPVCFCNSVGGFTLLAQKYTFSYLLSAGVVSHPNAALHKRYDSIFSPPP